MRHGRLFHSSWSANAGAFRHALIISTSPYYSRVFWNRLQVGAGLNERSQSKKRHSKLRTGVLY